MKSILLVEDDKALSNGIYFALKSDELRIIPCFDLRSARNLFSSDTFDLIILDINLPDGNGFTFLKEIRLTSSVPVIFLTVHDMETDIVSGLESGANDYITKPFSLSILRARVNIQLRKDDFSSSKIIIDDFIFDFNQMEFYKNNLSIDLSKTEQKLLYALVNNRGLTLTRETLIDKIWTNESEYVDENALSVTIKRLRDKLETNSSKPDYIKTIYGLGYTWAVKNK